MVPTIYSLVPEILTVAHMNSPWTESCSPTLNKILDPAKLPAPKPKSYTLSPEPQTSCPRLRVAQLMDLTAEVDADEEWL